MLFSLQDSGSQSNTSCVVMVAFGEGCVKGHGDCGDGSEDTRGRSLSGPNDTGHRTQTRHIL